MFKEQNHFRNYKKCLIYEIIGMAFLTFARFRCKFVCKTLHYEKVNFGIYDKHLPKRITMCSSKSKYTSESTSVLLLINKKFKNF